MARGRNANREMQSLLSIGLFATAAALALPQMQERKSCDWEVRATTPGAIGHLVRPSAGDAHWVVGGGVEAICGDIRVTADSASYYEKRGELYVLGNVRYRDEGRSLIADRATYYETGDWVRSQGNVKLTDSRGRSTLTGPLLDYFPANENRANDRIYAPNRPHMTFYPDSGGASEPFDVDADRIHIYGESLIAAAGRVEAVRGELNAFSDSMHLDLGNDELRLLKNPRVEANDVVLEGDTIRVLLEENRVREIHSWPNGLARGRELSLAAPYLRMFVNGEAVSRAVASAGDPSRTGATDSAGRAPWARSESEDYALSADSIDILRPGGRVEKVLAVRRARAVSLEPVEPGSGPSANDWLEGDTITGYFTAADSPSVSSDESQLSRLVAMGSARALYHVRKQGEESSSDHPPLNYVIGRTVTLWLEEGEVTEAEVLVGTGLYLEPAAPRPAADSLRAVADSASRARTDTLPRAGGAGSG